jgi:hypothetical protein
MPGEAVMRRVDEWQDERLCSGMWELDGETQILSVQPHEDECLPPHAQCALSPRERFVGFWKLQSEVPKQRLQLGLCHGAR